MSSSAVFFKTTNVSWNVPGANHSWLQQLKVDPESVTLVAGNDQVLRALWLILPPQKYPKNGDRLEAFF